MKSLRWIVLCLVCVTILYFAPLYIGGYSYTLDDAVRSATPYKNGHVLLEKKFGNRRLVVWEDGGGREAVMAVDKRIILYRVLSMTELYTPAKGLMRIAWSGHLNAEQRYDVILAAKVSDPRITKVVVTTDGIGGRRLPLEEAERKSSVKVEMEVADRYALQYLEMSPADTGNFVFSGEDERGNVIAIQ